MPKYRQWHGNLALTPFAPGQSGDSTERFRFHRTRQQDSQFDGL